jgi:hypothetical protein
MALGDLEVKGKLKVVGTTEMTGSIDLNGGALDTALVTNLNADKVDSADLDTDGALAANSDVKIPSQKAVKTYADARKAECVALTGAQTVGGLKTFSNGITAGAAITDKNGREVLAMTFESQHFDESFTPATATWTTRSKVFTFGGNVVALTFLNIVWGQATSTGNPVASAYIESVTISTTTVTVEYTYWSGYATVLRISLDIGIVY